MHAERAVARATPGKAPSCDDELRAKAEAFVTKQAEYGEDK